MELFVLIICNYDGDRYKISTEANKVYKAYIKACEEENYQVGDHHIYLVSARAGEDFGLDPRGGTYGCELLQEKDLEE